MVVLVEGGFAKRLVNYPYHGFKAEIVNVLEFKARNSDLRHPQQKNYYNLLFAFHVQNKVSNLTRYESNSTYLLNLLKGSEEYKD